MESWLKQHINDSVVNTDGYNIVRKIDPLTNMAAMHKDVPVPWAKESDLTLNIPMDPQSKAKFFRIDVFHTCHKGVMADLAANIIAPQLIILLPRFY